MTNSEDNAAIERFVNANLFHLIPAHGCIVDADSLDDLEDLDFLEERLHDCNPDGYVHEYVGDGWSFGERPIGPNHTMKPCVTINLDDFTEDGRVEESPEVIIPID